MSFSVNVGLSLSIELSLSFSVNSVREGGFNLNVIPIGRESLARMETSELALELESETEPVTETETNPGSGNESESESEPEPVKKTVPSSNGHKTQTKASPVKQEKAKKATPEKHSKLPAKQEVNLLDLDCKY